MTVSLPLCARGSSRGWSHHGYKHFAARGATRADTALGPAKYLPSMDAAAIRALEAGTRATPGWLGSTAAPLKTEHLRDVEMVIGWDEGVEATLSYVECAGGGATRTFHGRPVRAENRTARQLRGGEAR